MPNVPLKAGTKILVSGHKAVLTNDAEVDFVDLPNEQAIVESLQNDPHNFGLNKGLYVSTPEKQDESESVEPWIVYDDDTKTVSAPGYKTEGVVEVQADVPDDNVERIELTVDKPESLPKTKPKKASSKPVKRKAEKKVKKGSKKR